MKKHMASEKMGMALDEMRSPELISTGCRVRHLEIGVGQAKDGIDLRFVSVNKRKDEPPGEGGSFLSIISIDASSTHAVN